MAGSADRDGNELQSMHREEDLRAGRISNETNPEHKRIGNFEKHTKVMLLKLPIDVLQLNCRVLDDVYWNKLDGMMVKVSVHQ